MLLDLGEQDMPEIQSLEIDDLSIQIENGVKYLKRDVNKLLRIITNGCGRFLIYDWSV